MDKTSCALQYEPISLQKRRNQTGNFLSIAQKYHDDKIRNSVIQNTPSYIFVRSQVVVPVFPSHGQELCHFFSAFSRMMLLNANYIFSHQHLTNTVDGYIISNSYYY